MQTEVTFTKGTPAPAMTRDQAMTWLLGNADPMSFTAGLATSYVVGRMLADVARSPGKLALEVTTATGERYDLTATVTGRWYRRTVTYHAERVS